MESAKRLSRAFTAAEALKECPGCQSGKVLVTLDEQDEYLVACPLLDRKCTHGQRLGDQLDRHAMANVKALQGLPQRFHAPLDDPKPGDSIRGVNRWNQEGFLLLYGDHGTGKSFAAAYALYLLARKALLANWKYPTAWGAFNALWVSAYRATTKDDVFEVARTAPVLVLDDLGGEENTNRARARIAEIVSERYNHRKLTIITTNEDALKLEGAYGKRMADRILGDGLSVHCSGESWRLAS